MKRENLKAGGWVDLRDQADVSERLRRPVRKLQMILAADPAFSGVVKNAAQGGITSVDDVSPGMAAEMMSTMGAGSVDMMMDLQDHAIMSRVMGWSFEFPVTLDSLQDLPGLAYDEISKLCAPGALDNGPDFSPSQDPASPTDPSTASA